MSDEKGPTENAPDQYWIIITLIYNFALFDASLIVSVLSRGLVSGFILTYAIVVKPGLPKLRNTHA